MKHFTTAIHPAFSVGRTDPRLFGSFVEHMGSVVYNGIFQPGHPAQEGAAAVLQFLVRNGPVTQVGQLFQNSFLSPGRVGSEE